MDSNDYIIFRAVLCDLIAISKGWLKLPYWIHNCLLYLESYLFIYCKIVSLDLIQSLYDHVCAALPRFYTTLPQRLAVPVGDIH